MVESRTVEFMTPDPDPRPCFSHQFQIRPDKNFVTALFVVVLVAGDRSDSTNQRFFLLQRLNGG